MSANTQVPMNDPNVVMPAAVRAQIARSEEIIAQVYNSSASEGDGEPVDGDQGDPATTVADASRTLVSEAPKPEKKVTPQGNEEGDVRAHLQTMTGRYNAAMRDLEIIRGEYTAMRNRVDALERENEVLKRSPAPAYEYSDDVEFTPQEIEEYGEEFLNLVGKKAKQIVSPIRQEFDRKLADITSKVETTTATVQTKSKEELVNTLRREVPQFEALNTDAKFIDWLALPDPISGVIRQELLNDAVAKLNAARCAAIFRGYLDTQASDRTATGVTQDTAPAKPAPSSKMDLAALAAPGRAKTAPVTDTADKPVVTRSEIAQFYADVAQNKYSKEDVARIESIINSAMKENRIR